jgi:hypothetical protein
MPPLPSSSVDLALLAVAAAALIALIVLLLQLGRVLHERNQLRLDLEMLERGFDQTLADHRTELASLERFRDIRDAAATAQRLRQAAKDLYEGTQTRVIALQNSSEARAQAIREKAEREAETIRATALLDAGEARHKAEREGQKVLDAARSAAADILRGAQEEAEALRKSTRLDTKTKRERAEVLLREAGERAERIINEAHARAAEIAGDAYRALQESDRLQEVIQAMRNVIEGYGDRYLKPSFGLLDELAEAYAFEDAGRELKAARERSRQMVSEGHAGRCDYVEAHRRETAVRFIVDAFNGKVETILARVKRNNYGTLEQEIRDAYALVNHNGTAFRGATITPEYLKARILELKWATAVEVKRQLAREEQQRIREQLREEQKAQREIERALKEAAREEETLQKALAKVQAEAERASEAQRADFDARLAELHARLAEAEARNQRALSMAQQTRAGHVYIISNIGSFGDEVFKVGMTRRLEPLDRIKELGDASVPFAFDVHAMIWSEDAPALETLLHTQFMQAQVNKINPRKEFFRLPLRALREAIEARGITATWTMTAAAAEYRESLALAQQMAENPTAAQEWMRRQSQYVAEAEEEEVEALASA